MLTLTKQLKIVVTVVLGILAVMITRSTLSPRFDLIFETLSAEDSRNIPIRVADLLAALNETVSMLRSSGQKYQMDDSSAYKQLDVQRQHDHQRNQSLLQNSGWKVVGYYRGISEAFWKKYEQLWSSQVGQDKTIVRIFHGKRGGYFVDLAANDAVFLSNSLALEQHYGWRGLCVEANPVYLPALLERKCAVAVTAAGQKNDEVVTFRFDGYMGGIVGDAFDNKQTDSDKPKDDTQKSTSKVIMPTVTVEKLFEDFAVPQVIDYMSLDIEGAELFVFQNFPWNKYTFLTITVERPKGLHPILEKNGYYFVKNHGGFGDALYIHESLPNFDEVMGWYNMSSLKRKAF
jgi:hypothetical protein